MKRVVPFLVLIIIFLCGCGRAVDYSDKKIDRIEVDYDKDNIHRTVYINFATGERKLIVFGDETVQTTDSYGYLPELETFIRDKVLTDEKVNGTKGDSKQYEQKTLWMIRVYFDDGGWADVESMSGNPYTPSYYDELIQLIEK